ncbi:MAG TPA: Sua5/YciO/YrdC/YwlC family protein, partial [Thermoanaerobaculia bacterium]|nr:Sua5/YciO/YrdC/YwlC family protein [Thermoanaerobaculia bacterium]
SANRSGETPIRSVSEVAAEWLGALDLIADAGPVEGEVSAIVDFTGNEPELIREGPRIFTQEVWKTLRKNL